VSDLKVAELPAYTNLLEIEDLCFESELNHALREGLKVFKEPEGEAAEVNTNSVACRMKSSELFRIMSMLDLDSVGEQRTPFLSC
jgi:hypothetical protein